VPIAERNGEFERGGRSRYLNGGLYIIGVQEPRHFEAQEKVEKWERLGAKKDRGKRQFEKRKMTLQIGGPNFWETGYDEKAKWMGGGASLMFAAKFGMRGEENHRDDRLIL